MNASHHTLTITVYDQDSVYNRVGDLLHRYADKVLMRVGYPLRDHKTAVIFLLLNMTNDEVGALSGQLGQIDSVKVRTSTLKV